MEFIIQIDTNSYRISSNGFSEFTLLIYKYCHRTPRPGIKFIRIKFDNSDHIYSYKTNIEKYNFIKKLLKYKLQI